MRMPNLRGAILLTPAVFLMGAFVSNPAWGQAVGYWPLDEAAGPTAVDAVGTYDGTYTGAPVPSTSVPVPPISYPNPRSLTFSTNNYVTVADAAALQITGDITIAFWMYKTAEAGDWQRLVGKGSSANRNYGVWEWSGNDGRIKFQQYNAGASVLECDSTTPVALNTWTHIACTILGNAATVYINGNSAGTATRSGTPSVSADPLTFGYAGFHTYYPGNLDDIRIYNTALTATEVQILAMGIPAPTGVGAMSTQAGVNLNWTAPGPAGATYTYNVYRSTSATGPWTLLTNTSNTNYQDPTATGQLYYYAITAVSTVGESGNSTVVSGMVIVPRVGSDNDEGWKDGKCSCGTVAGVPSGWAALAPLLGAAALLLGRRRRRA